MIFNNPTLLARFGSCHGYLWLEVVAILLVVCGCGPQAASSGRSDGTQVNGTQDGGSTESAVSLPTAMVREGSGANEVRSLVLADPNCPEDLLVEGVLPSAASSSVCRKLWLGIKAEPAPRVLLDQFSLHCGLVVKEVVKGAPSDGLLRPSDLICQFNGKDLACEKRLCAMVAEAGSLSCRLTVIRKTQRIELEIVPQPVDILENGQIVQYTVLSDQGLEGMVDMPLAADRVAEKLRQYVVQPILLVDGAADGTSSLTDQPDEQLVLERVVSFGHNERGERILIVQEADRTLNYKIDEIKSACPEVQQLWELLNNQP